MRDEARIVRNAPARNVHDLVYRHDIPEARGRARHGVAHAHAVADVEQADGSGFRIVVAIDAGEIHFDAVGGDPTQHRAQRLRVHAAEVTEVARLRAAHRQIVDARRQGERVVVGLCRGETRSADAGIERRRIVPIRPRIDAVRRLHVANSVGAVHL